MWKWQPQGDGRLMKLFDGDREVLVIDESKLLIRGEVGAVYSRLEKTISKGSSPSREDEQFIIEALNEKIARDSRGST